MIKDLLSYNGTTVATVDQWEEKREDIKRRLFSTLGLPPEPRNTRDLTVIDEKRAEHYRRQRISYTVMQDQITAYLLIPDPLEEPAPAVVAMHQTVNSGKNEVVALDGCRDFAYGHDLAERGYIVIAPDYLTAGERVSPDKDPFDSAEFYNHYPEWSVVGKNMEDSMAAVDVLCMTPGVNTERIGVIGHSLGGHNAIFAMAVDNRIKAGVSNCGISVFSEEELRMDWSLEEGYIYIPALRKYFLEGLEPPFDIHEVAALIAPRAFLNISSYYDRAYGNQEFLADVGIQLYRVYKLYREERQFSWFMHGNDHSFPQYARALAYEWLDTFLKER
ncbi:MAG: alpha/beta hydrolase [Theionarchaea archaeon]|nr:alpha/beta hydrolase [Theionarchaea archaeon]